MLELLNFVRSEHDRLNMPRLNDVTKMLSLDFIENEIQSDKCWQVREVLQRHNPTVVER